MNRMCFFSSEMKVASDSAPQLLQSTPISWDSPWFTFPSMHLFLNFLCFVSFILNLSVFLARKQIVTTTKNQYCLCFHQTLKVKQIFCSSQIYCAVIRKGLSKWTNNFKPKYFRYRRVCFVGWVMAVITVLIT